MIIIFIMICLGLVFYGGYRYGSFHTLKENDTLRNQLQLQERFSRQWASEATDKYELSSKVAQQQTQGLGMTMHAVIQLLSTYQFQNAGSMNTQENEKVADIINKAKALAKLPE
jgi:hypothetical protein